MSNNDNKEKQKKKDNNNLKKKTKRKDNNDDEHEEEKSEESLKANVKKGKEDRKYIMLTNSRISGCDNKRLFYKCNICKQPIGQIDSVTRHFIAEHRSRINFLRNKLSTRDFLFAKAKIFILNVINKKVLSNGKYNNKNRQILTDVVFDPATVDLIYGYRKGLFKPELGAKIVTNIERVVYEKYLDFVEEYIKMFRQVLNDLPIANLENTDDEEADDDILKKVNFENFCDMNSYKKAKKGYYFLLDIPHMDTDDSLKNIDINDHEDDNKNFDARSVEYGYLNEQEKNDLDYFV